MGELLMITSIMLIAFGLGSLSALFSDNAIKNKGYKKSAQNFKARFICKYLDIYYFEILPENYADNCRSEDFENEKIKIPQKNIKKIENLKVGNIYNVCRYIDVPINSNNITIKYNIK